MVAAVGGVSAETPPLHHTTHIPASVFQFASLSRTGALLKSLVFGSPRCLSSIPPPREPRASPVLRHLQRPSPNPTSLRATLRKGIARTAPMWFTRQVQFLSVIAHTFHLGIFRPSYPLSPVTVSIGYLKLFLFTFAYYSR